MAEDDATVGRHALKNKLAAVLQLWRIVKWLRTSRGEWKDLYHPTKGSGGTTAAEIDAHPSFVARYEFLFADYTAPYRWFLLVDAGVACLVAGLSAISDAAGSCGAMAWVLVTLSSLYPVALLALRPFRERSEFLFALFVNTAQVGAAATAMKRSQVDDGTPLADTLDTALLGLGLGITAATVAWTVWEGARMAAWLILTYTKRVFVVGFAQLRGFDRWLALRWGLPEEEAETATEMSAAIDKKWVEDCTGFCEATDAAVLGSEVCSPLLTQTSSAVAPHEPINDSTAVPIGDGGGGVDRATLAAESGATLEPLSASRAKRRAAAVVVQQRREEYARRGGGAATNTTASPTAAAVKLRDVAPPMSGCSTTPPHPLAAAAPRTVDMNDI